MSDIHFFPDADLDALRARAEMLAVIRQHFAEQGVLEVETPLLCSTTAMDPLLESFPVATSFGSRFLQTSPEFPMKRLLAAGSGCIYQVCKSFRANDLGRRHNPEFSMLEWYRVGWSAEQLQQEVLDLAVKVGELFGAQWPIHETQSYRGLFTKVVGVDPFHATVDELARVASQHLESELPDLDRLGWLDLLMSMVVEPAMPTGLTMVVDFPAEQAALAQKAQDDQGDWVAKRFELYVNGVELANGYQELTDAVEQRQRFEADNEQRKALGFAPLPIPEALLQAMEQGIPDCAGVALGLDRLLMLALGKSSIEEVISFTFPNA